MLSPIPGVDKLPAIDRFAGHIRDQTNLGSAKQNLGSLDFKGIQHAIECSRVKSVRRAQTFVTHTGFAQLLLEALRSLPGRRSPRHCAAVNSRDAQLVVETPCSQLCAGFFLRSDQGDHSARRT